MMFRFHIFKSVFGRNHARLQNWSIVATRLQLCGVVVGEGGGRLSVDRRESECVKNK